MLCQLYCFSHQHRRVFPDHAIYAIAVFVLCRLCRVFLLIDGQVGLTSTDRIGVDMLEDLGKPYVVSSAHKSLNRHSGLIARNNDVLTPQKLDRWCVYSCIYQCMYWYLFIDVFYLYWFKLIYVNINLFIDLLVYVFRVYSCIDLLIDVCIIDAFIDVFIMMYLWMNLLMYIFTVRKW